MSTTSDSHQPDGQRPPIDQAALISSLALTALALLFAFSTDPLPLLVAFFASFISIVLGVKNYRQFTREFKVLGFNPFPVIYFADIIIFLITTIALFRLLFTGLLGAG